MSSVDEHCKLCGASDWIARFDRVGDYLTDENFAIRQCKACGLCVTDPIVTDDRIERYYPPRYRTDRQKYTAGFRVRRRAAQAARNFDGEFAGRLLDLGCGAGTFAVEMKRRKWTVAVTEINSLVLDELRRREIEAKRPDEAMRDGFAAPFDVITCWHVLEHVEHPLALAKWAHRQLAENGVFQVTVPNIASWQARLFGRHWLHLDVPRHRYHFTPQTLERLLNDAGFKVVRMKTSAIEYDLFGVIQSALNLFCSKPNVFFERLTCPRGSRPPASRRDLALSYLLAPLIGAIAVPFVIVEWMLGRGATLSATCRAR